MPALGYGVIEGFYGPLWSRAARMDSLAFMAAQGFSTYVYAPKADRWLRDLWRMPWPESAREPLRDVAAACRRLGLRWGVGLSPLGADARRDREALSRRLDALAEMEPDMLCLLFDDVRGDAPGLAERQCQLARLCVDHGVAERCIVCPTYYSNDPVLQRLFGPMPADYLSVLGEGLPAGVDVFWTGERVVSPAYRQAELAAVAERLGRRPVLWDNYPVNDFCPHRLHLQPFEGRPVALLDWCEGQLCNPMVQCRLSWLSLFSLAQAYRDGVLAPVERRWRDALDALCAPALAALLARDAEWFRGEGRDAIEPARRRRLIDEYQALNDPLADEVAEWLGGGEREAELALTG